MNTLERIELAASKAREAGYQVVEVWLGPDHYRSLSGEIRRDEKDFEWYGDLRVRKALEEDLVRVGATSCQWGAGKT